MNTVLDNNFLASIVSVGTPSRDGFLELGGMWYDSLSDEMQILLSLSSLSFIPAFVIAMTAFTRIVIVLSLLRHALGLMQTPPNLVIITLAIFLTWFVMKPVVDEVNREALTPYLSESISLSVAIERAYVPFQRFMISQTHEAEFSTILAMSNSEVPKDPASVKFEHLVPAFLLSELKTAFKIAFFIFIPFLLIDLVVASTLMALGMIMVPPISVALPIKIMVFVVIDGWLLVTQSLLSSFFTS